MQNKIKTVHFEIDENGKFYFNEESIHRIGRLAEHLLVNTGVINDDEEITSKTIEHLKYEAPDQFNTDENSDEYNDAENSDDFIIIDESNEFNNANNISNYSSLLRYRKSFLTYFFKFTITQISILYSFSYFRSIFFS